MMSQMGIMKKINNKRNTCRTDFVLPITKTTVL